MTGRQAEIRTARLRLEPLRVEHADEMATVLADPSLYAFTGGEPPTTAALRDRYALQVRGRSPGGAEAWHNWIVREAESGEAVGFVQATVPEGGATADVAWLIGVPWQGQGYATEAAAAMVDWLVSGGTRAITAHIHPDHAASAGVARRLGLAASGEVEDGEVVWRRSLAGATGPDDPGRRRHTGRLNIAVGIALVGFALFEVVFVRAGALPGGPDQVVRDALLAGAGLVMLGSGLVSGWRARRGAGR